MIRKQGRLRRSLVMTASAMPTLVDFTRGLWRSRGSRRWLIPLVVFLCVTGLVLALASTVEALAPFIYAIF